MYEILKEPTRPSVSVCNTAVSHLPNSSYNFTVIYITLLDNRQDHPSTLMSILGRHQRLVATWDKHYLLLCK